MDMEKYKSLSKIAIDRRIEEEKKKHFSNDEIEDEMRREASIKKIKNSLNIESDKFNGFEDYDFKRLFWESLKQDSHLSKEYKDMSEASKKMWQFFTDLNIKAKQLGYLAPKQGLNFFPLMEATIIEKLAKTNNILAESGDILKDLYSVRAEEEYQYSKIDEETGELKKELPKLFTRSKKDVKQLSTDLNKIGILWMKALTDYENSRSIENTLLVLHNVEKNKGKIILDASGKPVFEGGMPKTTENNDKNAAILQTIIDDGIYGLRENLSSIGNIGLSKVVDKAQEGKTEEDREKTKISTKKGLENANKLVQSLAVGLKLLVAIPNYVGFNMQAAINSGRLITFKEFEKNNAKITTGTTSTIEKALLDKIVPLNENISQEARRKLGKKQGLLDYLNTWSFHDVMMVTNSFPDRLLQFANALSFLENTMIVDGKLVNIRQYVAKEDRKRYKTLSFPERKALEQSYENRVQALKDEKSLPKVAKIEEDGLSIPGVSDEELAKYLEEYEKSTKYAHRYCDEWDLSRSVKTRAIAPTGSIGIIAETTTGIEPIFCVAYKRRYLKHTTWNYQYVIDPTAKRLIDQGVNPGLIEDAYSLAEDVERRVEMQAWTQKYVDHAISSTINLPAWGSELNNENKVQDFGNMLIKYLPQLRGITVYPDGSRGGQPLTPVKYEEAIKQTGQIFLENSDVCDITKGGSCGS